MHIRTLQARCLAVGQTLLGSYTIPTTVDAPLNLEVNPWGLEERSRRFVWNNGTSLFPTLLAKALALRRQRTSGHHVCLTMSCMCKLLALHRCCSKGIFHATIKVVTPPSHLPGKERSYTCAVDVKYNPGSAGFLVTPTVYTSCTSTD